MTKHLRPSFAALFLMLACHVAGQEFDHWFDKGLMRLDLVITGNDQQSSYALEEIRRETAYAGPLTKWLEPFDYGDHKFEIYDAASGALIFKGSFCTLFAEWQTTDEALQMSRAFSHVLRFPWPRKEVLVKVYDRTRAGSFELVWEMKLDPSGVYADPQKSNDFEVVDLLINGTPDEKVDVLFLAEGYTEDEMGKFIEDARRSAGYILSEEPFLSRRSDFNMRAVKSLSQDSGSDLPGQDIWNRTALNSRFYTFGIERYMTTSDMRAVADAASGIPYDQIYILVNTGKYGGGGIYNFYSVSAADNEASRAVVIHEFGHAFGGLADEYYNSKVAYNDYFPLDVEPWNPNLTTLVDFSRKWLSMLAEDTPVPTPVEDSNASRLGVYEGGGYVAKGVYRPMMDCRMHSNDAGFCPVCQQALEQMIDFHCSKK